MTSYYCTKGRYPVRRAHHSPRGDDQTINRNYSGPALGIVLASNSTRLSSIGFLGQYEYLREEVKTAEDKYIRSFFKALQSMHNTIDVNWVTSCKTRHQELMNFFSSIVKTETRFEFFVFTKNEHVYPLDDVGFCPKNFTVKAADEIEEEIVDIYSLSSYPKIYSSLFVAMFKVALACHECKDTEPDLFQTLSQLAFSLYEVGGLYNETNPDPKEWRRQEDNTLAILTQKPTRKPNRKVAKAYYHVKQDIQEAITILRKHQDQKRIKPYVLEISKAIVSNWYFLHSSYEDEDLYVSMAADAAEVEELKKLGISASILKSAFEGDPLVGCKFDEHVGYESHYSKARKNFKEWIKTIHITNPGKFKTRAIHLAIAAIQDRCAYIHRRLARLLRSIPSDCTINQKKGVDFTLKISNPLWREDMGWPSVLAFDWSNATDKLWSWFQEDVLKLVFDKEVVDLWHTVSTCPKLFCHQDGTKETYYQVNGQPQGLLGSFEAFALAHHMMMLITMRLSGRQDQLASDFYRVLGDDSIICSITEDRDNIVGNSYAEVCDWCNVPINRVKSTEILFDNPVALVEFAKVYTLDGQYFSPIPERLANRIGTPGKEYFAFAGAFWGQRHGMDNVSMMKRMIDKYYTDQTDNHLANLMLFSGVIPSFASLGIEFVDRELAQSEEAVKLALCYWLNKIKATFALNGMSDKAKENLSLTDKEIKDALLEFIPENLSFIIDAIDDNQHKLMKVLQQNLDKEDIVKQFLGCSDHQALVISANVRLTNEELDGIRQVIDLFSMLIESPELIMDYSSALMNIERALAPLERLNYRSIYKRDQLNLKVFRSTIELYKQTFCSSAVH